MNETIKESIKDNKGNVSSKRLAGYTILGSALVMAGILFGCSIKIKIAGQILEMAATYSSTPLPMQYHRRG